MYGISCTGARRPYVFLFSFSYVGGRTVYPKLSHNANIQPIDSNFKPFQKPNQIVIDVQSRPVGYFINVVDVTTRRGTARNSDRRLDLKLKYLNNHRKS